MPLPSSGSISLSQVNVELGRPSTQAISMGEGAVRTLFGVPSGPISMSQGFGKANQFVLTISSNQTNANLRTLAVNAGWNQTSKVVATINGGVYVSSNSTGTPGLTINGSFPNGVELINNGFIIGMGGAGGRGGGMQSPGFTRGDDGGAGGLALAVSVPVVLNNAGTIGGGGGGGGGGEYAMPYDQMNPGGGGGGGRTGAAANSSGGLGGFSYSGSGSSGGEGTFSAAGAGGAGGSFFASAGAGGGGGGWGSAGSIGQNTNIGRGRGFGGAAGAAISGNGNISYVATGTRLGAIS